MSVNNPSAVPPVNQVPDQRLEQMQMEMRQMREREAQLRGQIDLLSRQGQTPKAPENTIFKPELDQALNDKFQNLLKPYVQQTQQAIGLMTDRTDRAEFTLKYRDSKYAEYMPQVEQEMQRLQQAGQWVQREDILKNVVFSDSQKKVQEPVVQAKKSEPVHDVYTGQWVQDGKPVSPPSQIVITQEQQAQVAQPVAQPAPVQQQQHNWAPQLPNAQPPPAAAPASAGTPIHGLSIQATDRDLDAWADKYADIPL